ncbi:IS5 family transposase [Sphingomonas sp. ac-8]|uniref:IS5 family transposase n=1 Tax=Sphingomonas sp. ac-8 TaxID=3242977 RepID=UPI003A805FC6
MSRYDLTDYEWRVIEPPLPNKPRGVPRVDDRRVLNGIFWVLRSGAPWRDLPERYGPRTTCYNRFVRWRKADVWDRLMNAITAAHDGDIQMIDSTSIRAHQQAATAKTPDTSADAVLQIAGRLGYPAAAAVAGRSIACIRDWTNEATTSCPSFA